MVQCTEVCAYLITTEQCAVNATCMIHTCHLDVVKHCVQVMADAGAGKATPSEGEARAKRFLPFSAGTRDCVGQSLARMNYTTTVAMLLAHFEFKLTPEVSSDMQCHQTFVLWCRPWQLQH